jgi:hypothetical protein
MYLNTPIVFLNIIRRPKIESSFIDWVQESMFYLKMETDSSLWNVVF